MTLEELNAFKPGPGRWPNLIMDADGSRSREVDRFFAIVDAELNSDKAAHHAFAQFQGTFKFPRVIAISEFRRLVRASHKRNPEVLIAGLSTHVEQLVAWAILHQWIENA
jgi:hypothetical protein